MRFRIVLSSVDARARHDAPLHAARLAAALPTSAQPQVAQVGDGIVADIDHPGDLASATAAVRAALCAPALHHWEIQEITPLP